MAQDGEPRSLARAEIWGRGVVGCEIEKNGLVVVGGALSGLEVLAIR